MAMSIKGLKGIRPASGQGDHAVAGLDTSSRRYPRSSSLDKDRLDKGQDLCLWSRAPSRRGHTGVTKGLGDSLEAFVMNGPMVITVLLAKVPVEGTTLGGPDSMRTGLPGSSPGGSNHKQTSALEAPKVVRLDLLVSSLQDGR